MFVQAEETTFDTIAAKAYAVTIPEPDKVIFINTAIEALYR